MIPTRWLSVAAILALLVVVPGAHGQAIIYNQNFNGGNNGGMTVMNVAGTPFEGPWTYSPTGGVGGTGGWSTLGQIAENMVGNTSNLTTPTLTVPGTGPVSLSFSHRYNFEDAGQLWDGGALFISINGATFTQVPNSSFTSNGYNGTVFATSLSTLMGQQAFTGASAGFATPSFLTSNVNLGVQPAGTNFQLRWVAAYDSNTSGSATLPGEVIDWELDNVLVMGVPEPSSMALAGLGMVGAAWWRRRRR